MRDALDDLGLSFCNEGDRAVLVVLYEATGGDDWKGNWNWLSEATA